METKVGEISADQETTLLDEDVVVVVPTVVTTRKDELPWKHSVRQVAQKFWWVVCFFYKFNLS